MVMVEKIIEAISPDWAAKRAVARHDLGKIKAWTPSFGGGYAGGNDSRQRKSAAYARSFPGTEDAVAGYGLDRLRLEAMDLYRNSPLARSIVEISRRYSGQSRPRANTAAFVEPSNTQAAKDWDEEATDYFNSYWWPRMDYQRRSGVTMGTLQEWFVLLQWLQGDLAYVWTADGMHTIEGMQIRTPNALAKDPNVRNGFRYDSRGRATHMYYHEYSGYGMSQSYRRVNMQSVLFCPWFMRAAQQRSVPLLHGIIDMIRDHDEIHGYTLQKIKHESMLLSVERAGARKAAPGSRLTNSDGTETTTEKMEYGVRFKTTGEPGKDFQLSKGDTPNAQYVPAMEYSGQLVAAGAGLPYKALMSLFDGSWSSNKAVQTALKKWVLEIHDRREKTFNQRAYNICIAQGIREGHLPPAPVNRRGYSLFDRAEWTKPHFPQQDAQKEESGRSAAFQNMTASLEDFASEQGTTAEELRARHRENMQALKDDADDVGIPLEIYAAGLLAKSSSVSASTTEAS